MSALSAKWEAILDEEGLGSLDGRNPSITVAGYELGGAMTRRLKLDDGAATAGMLWREWAEGIAETLDTNQQLNSGKGRHVDKIRRRAIWTKYADGLRYAEIAKAVPCHISIVVRTIARVTACSPGAPVTNPWRRGPAVQPTANPKLMAVMLRAIADCADPWLLRERLAQEPQLAKLMGDLMPKSPMVKYEMIDLMRDLTLPGIPGGRDKAKLVNIDGRPHAGGIDVQGEGVVWTIPWHGIRSAKRAPEAE